VAWDAPENRLIMASGPLGGTRMMGSGTFSAVSKGPLTNGAFTVQANGFFGAYLRFCGYDGIILQGAAERLSYLYIHDGVAELRDATSLAGKDTWETEDSIETELGLSERALSVFSIGPAGENLVRFACIVGDRGHVAAHNGPGAVMGAKRLKAIAVARCKNRPPVANPERLSELTKELIQRIKTQPFTKPLYEWGTSMSFAAGQAGGWLPVKNYTTNVFPEYERFLGNVYRPKFERRRHPCWACQTDHCSIMKVTEGPAAGYVGEEPDYEQWAACGPVIGNTDVGLALRLANEIDRLGMDVNETGWLVGWVMECYERGLLTREQLDGLDMRWGNVEATEALLEKVAHREGIGDLLAEGVMRASQHIGGEAANCAIYTRKGNSPRGHDHRSKWTELLETVTSSTGTLESGTLVFPEDYGLPSQLDPFDPEDVAASVAKSKGRMVFEDSLGVCYICSRVALGFLAEILNAATGWDFSGEDARRVGLRTVNLLRVFNIRHGIGRELDAPSVRYASVPVDGPTKGRDIGAIWDRMLARYYELLGWDVKTGKPLPETLRGLGLGAEAADIWQGS
jgi:aldehyde:ferredoxin oxidoreductase